MATVSLSSCEGTLQPLHCEVAACGEVNAVYLQHTSQLLQLAVATAVLSYMRPTDDLRTSKESGCVQVTLAHMNDVSD